MGRLGAIASGQESKDSYRTLPQHDRELAHTLEEAAQRTKGWTAG